MMENNCPGYFISFEGGEGSGKSTQIARVFNLLQEKGIDVVATREPGGTPIAEGLRAILLDPAYAPSGLAELFILEAARTDLTEKVIRPALYRGAIVMCDRTADSSTVYQGVARGLGIPLVELINYFATGGLEPDITYLFDLQPTVGLDRVKNREKNDRLDQEAMAFHEQVRAGYLAVARRNPHRFVGIDASLPEDQVSRLLLGHLVPALRDRGYAFDVPQEFMPRLGDPGTFDFFQQSTTERE